MKAIIIDFNEKPYFIPANKLEDKDIYLVEEINRLIIYKVRHIDIKDGYVKIYYRRSQNINIELDICENISVN